MRSILRPEEVQMISYYYSVPNNRRIQEFLKEKVIDQELQGIVEQYYFLSSSKKNLYLIISICFNGTKIVKEMKKINQKVSHKDKYLIDQANLQKMQKIIRQEFVWQYQLTPIELFRDNFKNFKESRIFKFFSQEIFAKIGDKVAEELFLKTIKDSGHLSTAKIRWVNKQQKIDKNIGRKYEKIENESVFNSIYLVVIEEDDNFLTGCFRTVSRHDTMNNSTPRNKTEIDIQNESHLKKTIPQKQPKKEEISPGKISSQMKYIEHIQQRKQDEKVAQLQEKDVKCCCQMI